MSAIRSDSVRELGRAMGVSAISRSAAVIASLGVNVLIARHLTLSEYSYVGVLISISSILMVFLQFGYQTSIVRTASEAMHADDRRELSASLVAGFWVIIILSLLTFPILFIFRGTILPQINGHDPSDKIVTFSMIFITTITLNVFWAEAIRGIGKVGAAASLTGMGQHGGIARSGGILIICAVFASRGVISLTSVLLASIVISMFVAVVSLRLLRTYTPIYASLGVAVDSFRRALHKNVRMMLGQALQLFASQHATLIIGGAILSGTPFALLVAAQQLRNILTAPMTLFNGSSPKLVIQAFREHNLNELERLLRIGTSSAFIFVLLASFILIAGGDNLFILLFGSKFKGVSTYFISLIPGLIAFSMGGTAGRALILLGREREFMRYSIIISAFTVPTSVFASKFYGSLGLAIATSVVLIVQNIILVLMVRRLIGVWSHAYLSPKPYMSLLHSSLAWGYQRITGYKF